MSAGPLTWSQPSLHPSGAVDSGLVAWYPFDGNAQDASGNGNHGIVRGLHPTADRRGSPKSALLFIAEQDDVTFRPSSDFDFLDSHAISAGLWCLFMPGRENRSFLFGIGGGGSICRHFELHIGVSGVTAFGRVNASECKVNVRGSISSDGGSWHHIVVGADDRSLVLYVDGALADRRAVYDMKWDTPSMIENQLSGYRDDFSPVGIAVDDLRIYRRVLSADEVLNMYLGNAR